MTRPRTAWRAAFTAALLAVAALLVAPAAALPGVPGTGTPGADKLVHAALFAALGLLARRAFPKRAPVALFVFLAGLGALTEFLQAFVPGRAPEIGDVIANAVGAAAVFAPHRRGTGNGPRNRGEAEKGTSGD